MKDGFPSVFHRGISQSDAVRDGHINSQAFVFKTTVPPREDNYKEMSINWHDDKESISTLLKQHKPHNTEYQFKIGYCTVDLNDIDSAIGPYLGDGSFDYERKPIVGDIEQDICENKYHGNLLLKASAPSYAGDVIRNVLAGFAQLHLRSDEEE